MAKAKKKISKKLAKKKLLNLNSDDKNQLRKALISGSIMLSAFLIRQGLEISYKKISGKEAPKDPKHGDSSWQEALVWAIVTGAFVGLSKTFLRTQIHDGVDKLLEEV